MTKRFTMVITGSDGSFHYWDKFTDERITSTLELEDKLNELNDENEQLKQFKEKVFVLLDEKIKHYEHKPFSAPISNPANPNYDADVDRIARLTELQNLRKEIME